MLSHNYRMKLEEICGRIARGETVELSEIIWAEKLSQHNAHAAKILRQARRSAENPTMQEGDLDDFMNQLDLGGLGHERFGRRGFDSPDDLHDWFKRDEDDENWRRRD